MASERDLPAWRALREVLEGGGPEDGDDAEALLRVARSGEVLPLLVRARPELAERCAGELERHLYLEMHLEQVAARARDALSRAGIERLARLKGSATAHLLYDSPSDRPRRDLDLLVDEGELEPAIAALEGAGFRAVPSDAWWSRSVRFRHEQVMRVETPAGSLECDLHRRLVPWTVLPIDHAGILDRARQVPGVPLPLADAGDLLLHSALHVVTTGFRPPLRAYVDIRRLAAAVEPAEVAARARRWRVERPVFCALAIAARWFGASEPGSLADVLAPARPVRALLERALSGEGADPLRLPEALRQPTKLLALGGRATRLAVVRDRLRAAARQ